MDKIFKQVTNSERNLFQSEIESVILDMSKNVWQRNLVTIRNL